MERIFHRGWVFVGHESEIPAPGDFVTRHIGPSRSSWCAGRTAPSAGARQPLHAPRHLGVRGRASSARTFACPYHGWTYDLSGALLGVPYPAATRRCDKRAHGLARAAARGPPIAASSSRASVADGLSLAEHLGPATRLIDRSCDLAPDGEIELQRGLGQASLRRATGRCCPRTTATATTSASCTPRSVQDGPHPVPARGGRRARPSRRWCATGAAATSRSTGRPATSSPSSGSAAPPARRWPTSSRPLERRDGAEAARRRFMEGPAHALIFPNLFLGETNIAIVQPLGVEECVHWHTPMFLKGRAAAQQPAPAHGRGGHGSGVAS